MRISKGDDTSPVGNDRISYGRFARISKFRDMLHYSLSYLKLVYIDMRLVFMLQRALIITLVIIDKAYC